MFKGQKILDRLERLEGKMDRLIGLYGEVGRLEKQNRELFDRLMARNWDQWVNSPAVSEGLGGEERESYVLSPTQDESNVGEALSDEEIAGK